MTRSQLEGMPEDLQGLNIRRMEVEGEIYVCLSDYTREIQMAVDKIVGLAKEQETQMEAVAKIFKAYNDVLKEHYKEIHEEFVTLANQKINAC